MFVLRHGHIFHTSLVIMSQFGNFLQHFFPLGSLSLVHREISGYFVRFMFQPNGFFRSFRSNKIAFLGTQYKAEVLFLDWFIRAQITL